MATGKSADNRDAHRWNERYRQCGEAKLERGPRGMLESHAHLLPKRGLALDAAAGIARNALFMAQGGLDVIAMDISEVALRLSQRRARQLALPFQAVVCDLANLWLPAASFDVIANFLFLRRDALPVYQQALKPGGILFFESFIQQDARAERSQHYLQPGEIIASFQNFEILHSALQPITTPYEVPSKMTEQLIARKPDWVGIN